MEFEPQTRIEGELQQLPADFPVIELWQILQGLESGRTQANEITVFDSVGFALEDLSALRYLHQRASAMDIGRQLEIVPRLLDPKDLYGYAMGQAASLAIAH